ncbi:MAG TPA: hypothetical protein VMQ67_05115, partial [Candidatus Saccharimonadales bacterium]|nr:hypothetical protein [Candidatus Saccharimonadales bacterium]
EGDSPPTKPFGLSVVTSQTTGLPQFELSGEPGHNYDVEASTDLISWAVITNLVNTNGTVTFDDQYSTNYTQRFYRVVSP